MGLMRLNYRAPQQNGLAGVGSILRQKMANRKGPFVLSWKFEKHTPPGVTPKALLEYLRDEFDFRRVVFVLRNPVSLDEGGMLSI